MAELPQNVEPANHHYVPKFYLKGFTNKGGVLWVYEMGKNAPRTSTPKQEGHRENFYTFTDRGHADNSTEQMLSRVESMVAPVIRKLANPLFQMNDQQCSELYSFIALMFVRVPAFREFINHQASKMMKHFTQSQARDRDSFYKGLKEYEEKSGEFIANPEKLREFLSSDDYTVTQRSDGFNLLQTFQACLSISDVLETEYRHDIFYAPRDLSFITCDNPIVTIEPDIDGRAWVGMGFGRPRTEVLFPLNKRACMILSRTGSQRRIQATPFRVQKINDMMMYVSQRFAYSPIGQRRMARIFNERGCKVRYGENAFMAGTPLHKS